MGSEIDNARAQLDALMRRGRAIVEGLAAREPHPNARAEARIWQRDCEALVAQLSGGSKAHWLSRAYSSALLVRSTDGAARAEASLAEIVARLLGVLQRAADSLLQADAASDAVSTAARSEPPRRFDFVRHEPLRPVLEQAYAESARALDEGQYTQSLMTTCSMLEAVITDALEAEGGESVGTLSFADRIAAAERRRLIRSGCARLPPVARAYRNAGGSPDAIVTRRDAAVARQVLHVVLRDLDPGR